jgi:signal transduction histidine kinase
VDVQAGEPLSFPDGPKLELDELIEQLVDRARDVQRAQGRLRGLLRANESVTAQLSLADVLQHIVEAACALAGARYGALGVIGSDGGLEQFIHTGMADDLVERIGHLPEGRGLLGALISDPRPIRLAHITDDPRSSGFPAGHPPMASFLGVPIRVRGEIYGNLYLTESKAGAFTDEDAELVRSLANSAGTAISNARLYAESGLQQRWLAASAEIGAQVLAASGEDALHMVARRASELAAADLVTVALLTPDRQHALIEISVGDGGEDLIARRLPLAKTLLGQAIESGGPLLVRGTADAGYLSGVLEPGPMMIIPLVGTGEALGALSIVRRRGRKPFSAGDLEMAAGFANHASIALELAKARADQQRMVLLEDRDRIARDLHDHVIQQLFAIGLGLESVAGSAEPRLAGTLRDRVDEIDRTIRQIRTTIFELRGPLGAAPSEGLRTRLLSVAAEVTPALGCSPSITFTGPVDLVVEPELADDTVACLREALTNAARHAHASAVEVTVGVEEGRLSVVVRDNGVGLAGDAGRRSGTANLAARAERRGGGLELVTPASGGTELIWKAPLT